MGPTGQRIVLAEVDCLLRKAAETALTRNGFQVFTVADGEEAPRVTRAELPAHRRQCVKMGWHRRSSGRPPSMKSLASPSEGTGFHAHLRLSD